MPRVYGGSPGKPRSRSGSQLGKSALVYSLRIGCPEMVVNSDCLSGFFSSAGWRVFFCQACSFGEGIRSADEVSSGGAACVAPLDFSLMLIAPARKPKMNRNFTKINAMRKARKGQAWRGSGGGKKELVAAGSERKNDPGERPRAAEG